VYHKWLSMFQRETSHGATVCFFRVTDRRNNLDPLRAPVSKHVLLLWPFSFGQLRGPGLAYDDQAGFPWSVQICAESREGSYRMWGGQVEEVGDSGDAGSPCRIRRPGGFF